MRLMWLPQAALYKWMNLFRCLQGVPFVTACTVSKKKSERRFFCFEPPIRISGYCLALDSYSGGREQSELLELRRIKKGVIGLALGHVSLPSPP
jgi:hypothetical protein